MATTAPMSPRREVKVNPEPKKIKQYETESPATSETASQSSGTVSDEEADNDQYATVAPDHEAIARAAYGYWLERENSGQGSAEEDWYRAEQELRSR